MHLLEEMNIFVILEKTFYMFLLKRIIKSEVILQFFREKKLPVTNDKKWKAELQNYVTCVTNSWSYIQKIVTCSSGSGKINKLFSLTSHQYNINRICLYEKDSHAAKLQLLINKRKSVDTRHCRNSKAFLECSSNMNDIYENSQE